MKRKKDNAATGSGESNAENGTAGPEPKVADIILEQTLQTCDLFHDERKNAYATVHLGSRTETMRLGTPRFRRFVAREVHRVLGTTVARSTLDSVILTLDSIALFERPLTRVHVRVGTQDGRIYIDISDQTGSCIEVTSGSWRMLDGSSPVRFLTPDTAEPLVRPARGGLIDELQPFVPLSRTDFLLLVGWLLAALRPDRPCPALVLSGQQGAGKSSLTRTIRLLVDPSAVPLRAPPRSEEHLFISALNSRVLSLENVSQLRWDMSDALCRLVTGGGLTKRSLYTDDGESTIGAMRAIVLNGIGSIITRPDLAERALVLNVQRLPDKDRLPEAVLWERFESSRPRVLGALLDGLASALAHVETVQLDAPPRMADFAVWIAAAAPGLGLSPNEMLDAYASNRSRAVEAALEASPVASALRIWITRKRQWEGTPRQLHDSLGALVGDDLTRTKYWPKTPNHFTGQLRRDETFLRAVGIDIVFRHKGHERWIVVSTRPSGPSGPSGLSNLDDATDDSDAGGGVAVAEPVENCDASDESDGAAT